MKDFKGKVAVITGAASGIGYGLAEHAAQEGMKVVLADVEEAALTKAEKNIRALGANTLAVKTDVSKADDVKALAEKTLDAFGAVHLLCNNAGVYGGTTIWGSTLADWQWVLGVNLWGVIHGVHYFVPIMLKQDTECHVVNTASVNGLFTVNANGTYAVSKHGVVALSETLYREFEQGGYNIGVSVLCPGYIKTNILEAGRNRPKELQNKPGEGIETTDLKSDPVFQAAAQAIDNGMLPQRAADIVFDAIRQNKFYILPNAEEFVPMIKARMEDILQERNPTSLS
jgi:NAD(P)-dependent dehydrogenase (short-subunit alcohol dehydrogenase family)